jgi:erythritol transport system substrate-binding protein
MSNKTRRLLLAACALALPVVGGFATSASAAGGLISIIVNDPANPYWLTEGKVADAEAKKLGYSATVGASKGDTNTESNLVDTAITNKSVAIILDPANASGSIGAVKKAIAANIPVFLVNAEINQQGLAKAQLVSNNAQGAALGAEQWVKDVGQQGNYVELLGNPADNNAATRSNGYETVLSQYPGLVKVGSQVANWDRTQGHDKMQSLLQAHPKIIGRDRRAEGSRQAVLHQGRRLRRLAGCRRRHQGGRDAVHRSAAGRDLLGEGRGRGGLLPEDGQDGCGDREAAV